MANHDFDILNMSLGVATIEILRLRNAIRRHRDFKGNDRCKIDDDELYLVLPEKKLADQTLPSEEEFIEGPQGCRAFWRNRRDKQEWTSDCGEIYPPEV